MKVQITHSLLALVIASFITHPSFADDPGEVPSQSNAENVAASTTIVSCPKPPYPHKKHPSNLIEPKITHAWFFDEIGDYFEDWAGGKSAEINGTSLTRTALRDGFGINSSGFGSRGERGLIAAGDLLALAGNIPFAIFFGGCVSSGELSNPYPRVLDKSSSGGSENGYSFFYDRASGKYLFRANLGNSYGSPAVPRNVNHRIALVCDPMQKNAVRRIRLFYWEGQGTAARVANRKATFTIPAVATNTSLLNRSDRTEDQWDGDVEFIMVAANQRFSDTEITQLLEQPYQVVAGGAKPSPVLTVDDSFERSSIDVASTTIDGNIINLRPRVQTTTRNRNRFSTWAARLKNVNDGSIKTIRVKEAASHLGPSPPARRPVWSYDRVVWHLFDHSSTVSGWRESLNDKPWEKPEVYIAASQLFGMTELGRWLAEVIKPSPYTRRAISGNSAYVFDKALDQVDDLGRTIPSQPLYAFQITDPTSGPLRSTQKQVAVMFAGTHGGEDVGNYALKGAVEFLISSDPMAAELRREFVFLIYPMTNPMGRTGGRFRGQWDAADLAADPNRHIDSGQLDVETKLQKAVLADAAEMPITLFVDFHGWRGQRFGYYTVATAEDRPLITQCDIPALRSEPWHTGRST